MADLKKWGKAAAKGGVIGVAMQARRDKGDAESEAAPLPSWVPAGWYPDPLGLGAARYWDGSSWSGRYRDAPPPEPVPDSPPVDQPQQASDGPPAGDSPTSAEPSKREVRRAQFLEAKAAKAVEKTQAKEAKAVLNGLRPQWASLWKAGKLIFSRLNPSAILDVEGGRIITKDGIYPLSAETVANVVVSGNIVATSSRRTLTREATMGIFATQKKGKVLDQRNLMLQAEDHGLGWAFTLSGPPKAEVTVRQFAQNLGLAVSALAPAAEDAPASAPAGSADELAKLAQLKETGVLTEDEFTAAKARLLGI
ncbi:MAG: DUF2510 domain-containing protein [Solirubrobacteraceae bacterium]|jgi:hypothetical protein